MEPRDRRNPYLIPRLYIEGIKGDEYLVESGEGVYKRSKSCPSGSRCYGKAIYGVELDSILDLLEKKVKRSFIVEPGDKPGEGILVESGVHAEPIPVSGKRAVIEVLEGDEVKEGDVLGLIVTGKYELRKVRSHVDGIVVYIYSSPMGPPDENIVFIVPRDQVKRIKIEE
ncbi:DUF2118 family protein [Pyrolobus fumarii]|uniref:DUF2118 family protein n=1 Tax=Pyrolobus fumarii TaxID=54252 RepID=UPI001FCBC32F|nr:DUF2118 domain-containing protein [Pyrolobus fumarii]